MVLATRGSMLALRQAEIVKMKLEAEGERVTILPVTTKGDRDRIRPLREIGGDGLFMRELERVLLSGEADLAVHSAKDLPFTLAEGLVIGGVPEAADPWDCLVCPKTAEKEEPARIGTGSPRRIEECGKIFPDALCAGIRGNINTRIERLREGAFDGIILAKAGLDRLAPDLSGLSVRVFSPGEMVPAPCQGILAAECREGDEKTREILARITDREALSRFLAERYVFEKLEADCSTPLGVYAEMTGEEIIYRVLFGKKRLEKRGNAADYWMLGDEIVRELRG